MIPFYIIKQRVHYLHGILRLREYTLVLLSHQLYAFLLEPSAGILCAEYRKGSAHQIFATGIYLLQISYLAEGIGQVTASATRHGYFGQCPSLTLKDVDIGIGHHPLQVNGAETSCCSRSYDGYGHSFFHFNCEVTSFFPHTYH